ncbi:MAG: polynucleotide adenylyltransferase region, partial [uncultured bacterium]
MFLKLKQFEFIKGLHSKKAQVCVVGGNVRDQLLGRAGKDLDLLVRLIPYDELCETLKNYGMVNVVGKSFGVIKFRPRQDPTEEIDISLPRIEKSTGSGHKDFLVDFNPQIPVEQDLARRDFTINAMAYDLATGQIIDPFGGQEDLKKKQIRQVFIEAFIEDPLRMLRAVQFAARFNFVIEAQTFNFIKEHAALIQTVSKERIILEIKKLFSAEKPSLGFDLMRDSGLLPFIFPFIHKMIGIIQPQKRNEDVYTHTMKVLDASRVASEMEKPGDLDIMFSALLHDAGKPKTYRLDPQT